VGAVRRLRRGTAIGVAIAVLAAVLVASGSATSDLPITFKGHGVKALRVFHIVRPSTVFWTNTGSYFQISSYGDYAYYAAVTSHEHGGTTYIGPCTYDEIRVRAIGSWTITIRPGVEKLGKPIVFSGSGERALRPFTLRRSMTMYWTNSGDRFQTISMTRSRNGTVSSGLHRGKVHLQPGRHQFVVDAVEPDGPVGSWQIVIR
jgi:hypothetical protein